MLALLRPHPHRGDTVAAGVVVLTLFTVLVNARFAGEWSDVARLLFTLAFAAPVVVMAVQAVSGDAEPRPYESVLHVASFVLVVLTLGLLADVLGAEGGSGSTTWVGALVVGYALWFARRRNSAIMTLLAALAAVITFIALVDWVLEVNSASDVEWLLLICAIVLTLGAVSQRDARRRHAVSLADAAGLTIFALGLVVLVAGVVGQFVAALGGGILGDSAVGTGFSASGGGTGWELVLLAFGFGLIAYGSVDRERVPQFIGVGVLLMFLVQALWPGEDGPSLVGWPIVLLVLALGLLVIGLRPRQDLPPEPEVPHA
ncbi:MAG: hypothetical protein ACJ762_00790 [Solirubrobacteraceae bacterium]